MLGVGGEGKQGCGSVGVRRSKGVGVGVRESKGVEMLRVRVSRRGRGNSVPGSEILQLQVLLRGLFGSVKSQNALPDLLLIHYGFSYVLTH